MHRGRPRRPQGKRKVTSRLREKRFNFRLSEDDYETLRSKASIAGMSMSEFVIETCVRGRQAFEVSRLPGADADDATGVSGGHGLGPARTESLHIKLTEDEKRFIAESARRAGLTMTRFVVETCVRGRIEFIGDPDFFRSYMTELNRQGVNLNQIAVKVNALSQIAWREDVDAGKIDELVRDLVADNERTRPLLNDALRETRRLMLLVREGFEEAAHGDA